MKISEFFLLDELDVGAVPIYDVGAPFVFYLGKQGGVIQEYLGERQTRVTVPLLELSRQELERRFIILMETAGKVMGIKGPMTADPVYTGRHVKKFEKTNLLIFEPSNLLLANPD